MHITIGIEIDRHVLAWISIAAIVFDLLGGLYLAYDLLGGQHGPLRTLTRAVTYGMYFSFVYGFCFGAAITLAGGVLSTISPFIEWWADHLPPRRLGAFGAILLLLGLGLSSLQYWVTIFDIPIR